MNTERLKNFYDYNGSKILEIKPGMQIEIHEKDVETSRIRRFKCLVIKVKKPNHADGTSTWSAASTSASTPSVLT